jgi:uncharacterized protein (DUF1810 family)
LQETKRDGIRYCDACDSNVYLCETDSQLLRHILSDHCVAIPMQLRDRDRLREDDEQPRQTWLGQPDRGLKADPHNLSRFVVAQREDYRLALSQIYAGSKRSPWVRFVFPQIIGPSKEAAYQRFAIKSIAEAKAYLDHPVLGARLMECCEALVRLEDCSAEDVFGAPNHLRLKSSATLFAALTSPGSVFEQVLEKFFAGQRDEETIKLLETTDDSIRQ